MKMCSYLLVVFLCCLVAPGNLWGADDAAVEKKKAAQDKRKAAQERMAKMAAAQFKKLDKDGNERISLEEFKATKRSAGAGKVAEALFKLLDKNDDGTVCLEEFTTKPPEFRFKMMDKDGDGVLSFDEFKGRREKPEAVEQAEQSFKRLDKDGDVKLTLEEFKQAQQRVRQRGGRKARQDNARILGTWEVVEKNGDSETGEKGNQCVFAEGKMTIKLRDDNEPFDLKYELDPEKQPRALDLEFEHEGQTHVLKCIYSLEGDALRICGAASPEKPRPREFKAKEDEQNVYVLKRVRKTKG